MAEAGGSLSIFNCVVLHVITNDDRRINYIENSCYTMEWNGIKKH